MGDATPCSESAMKGLIRSQGTASTDEGGDEGNDGQKKRIQNSQEEGRDPNSDHMRHESAGAEHCRVYGRGAEDNFRRCYECHKAVCNECEVMPGGQWCLCTVCGGGCKGEMELILWRMGKTHRRHW